VAESGENQNQKEKENTQVTGVNVTAGTTFEGIKQIFEQAEFERKRDNAEEKLLELVHEKIDPVMAFGLDYDEFYDDFVLEGEWYDWDQGDYRWVGNLQYFIKYRNKGGYLSDEELVAQVDAILEDLNRRIAERDARSPSATGRGDYENDDE